jgi:hypothetical protein
MAQFWGDGKYIGDGGTTLQKLWESSCWREIKGCPGRYTCASKILRSRSLRSVLVTLGIDVINQDFTIPGKDNTSVARFPDGGGLLTYSKVDRAFADGTVVFVHTFNTESGLLRKLAALNIVLLESTRPRYERATLHILSYLLDTDINQAAHILVLKMRIVFRSELKDP